jgi:hypothetical protein
MEVSRRPRCLIPLQTTASSTGRADHHQEPSRPLKLLEIEGFLDEEDDPEIKKRPEIVPEKPPPAPWDRADCPFRRGFGCTAIEVRTMTDREGGSGGVLRLRNLAMIENIRRGEDPASRERLER